MLHEYASQADGSPSSCSSASDDVESASVLVSKTISNRLSVALSMAVGVPIAQEQR